MGIDQSSLKLRDDFLNHRIRKMNVGQLSSYYSDFVGSNTGTTTIAQNEFVKLFQECSAKEANQFFSLFSDRLSTRDLCRTASRKASILTLFTGACALCKGSFEDKSKYLFELFDLNHSSSLSQDEFTVLITCQLRSLTTLYKATPSELSSIFGTFQTIIEEPFEDTIFLLLDGFRKWATRKVERIATFMDEEEYREISYKNREESRFQPSNHHQHECKSPQISPQDKGKSPQITSFGNQSPQSSPFENQSTRDYLFENPGSARSSASVISEVFRVHEEEEENFMDADKAVEQILNCLPEIDDGDLSSLPWMLDALKLLADHNNCEKIVGIISSILPLICNVCACEDSMLAADALNLLASFIDGAPETLQECSSTVNERSLMEMVLTRSSDVDTFVACAANMCLHRLTQTMPYGFGRTIAALLEAGTLHEIPEVVISCASTAEQCIQNMPDNTPCDLEGRLGLVLSALCLWAHGDIEECAHCAKLMVIKLSIRFGELLEWDEAIRNTESALLEAWNLGMDPSPEDLKDMEEERDRRKREMEILQSCNTDAQQKQYGASQRGWIVQAGFHRNRCNPEACMYPQVFAYLQFKGRGGPIVGISFQSNFDTIGTFRRREIVTESRRVEVSKIMWNGKVQVWEEEETNVRETTHMEAANGEFAHRELSNIARQEKIDGSVVAKEKDKKDFVHLKNETGEYSTYIDPTSPGSPQLRPPQEDISNFEVELPLSP